MITGLSVLVLGDILTQLRKFSGLAFVIVLYLELAVLGEFATAKARFCV